MTSTPPPSGVRVDPLTSILGSAEWLSRPRGHAGGASASSPSVGAGGETTSASSPREGRDASGRGGPQQDAHHPHHRHMAASDGSVWRGVLRLSEGPWQKRGLRQDDLPEGNTSSRETSLSDDGSGASDSVDNPEVTKKNRTGVNFSHEGSNAGLLLRPGGGGGGGVGSGSGGGDAEGAAGGDGNSSVGEEEEEEEGSGATGSGDPGGAVTDPTPSTTLAEADAVDGAFTPHGGSGSGSGGRVTHKTLKKQHSVTRDDIEGGGGRRGGSRKGSYSGADVMGRAAGRAMAARASTGAALMCSLIARPPPNNAGIPGTAGGEGQARAAAAGASRRIALRSFVCFIVSSRLVSSQSPNLPFPIPSYE